MTIASGKRNKSYNNMISRTRMKKDLIGQSAIIAGLAVAGLFSLSWALFLALLSALGLWQGASALQLALAYEYEERYPFLWLFLGLLLALPPAVWLLGTWAVAPIALGLAAYFIVTVRDTLYVLQRPRSFWDL